MHPQFLYALDVAHERRRQAIDTAASERQLERPRPSLRRSVGRRVIAVGHRFVAVGHRIAAEPSLELARSR
jgi:hypothetical protein